MHAFVPNLNVGAHVDGHQNAFSMQISINFGENILRLSCILSFLRFWT